MNYPQLCIFNILESIQSENKYFETKSVHKPYQKYFLSNLESYLVDFKNIENDINLYFNRIIEPSYLNHSFDLV